MARRQTGGRSRAALFLIISLVASVGATGVIYNIIRGFQEELATATQKEEMYTVVAAKDTLYQGQTITEEDVYLKELPPTFAPDAVFFEIKDIKDRVPAERILPHDLVRAERLASREAGTGLNAIIPRGMRAVSVNVTDGSAVSGFLNPGNYVDILVTINDAEQRARTLTLLQAVSVLAVNNRLGGRAVESSGRVRPSVTLAVTPGQAEKLAHAQMEGDVTLTLRNDVDVTEVETNGTGSDKLMNKLIGNQQAKVENVQQSDEAKRKSRKVRIAAESAPSQSLQVIRGTDAQTIEVDANGNVVDSSKKRRR